MDKALLVVGALQGVACAAAVVAVILGISSFRLVRIGRGQVAASAA